MRILHKNILVALTSFALFVHWSKETSINNGQKPSVNFEGTIILPSSGLEASELNVENITIEGKYKGILVYAKPTKSSEQFEDEPNLIKINDDPRKGVKRYLNLDKIKQITVPNRRERWAYQRSKKAPKIEYIEISVTSKGPQGTIKKYLVESSYKVRADEKDPGGPIRLESSFAGIDTIIISGYHEQKSNKNSKKNNSGVQEPRTQNDNAQHNVDRPEVK